MRIEAYFHEVRAILDTCPTVQSSNLTFDKRSTHEGFIRGEVYFVDGSVLHVREFVDVEASIDRLTYAYQYMAPDRRLMFRYDNSGHHRNMSLPTYPHHKHEGREDHVVPASAPDLAQIIRQIEAVVQLP